MGAICGFAGEADPAVVAAMLDAVRHRGDRSDIRIEPGMAFGFRYFADRPGKAQGIAESPRGFAMLSGGLAPGQSDPASRLHAMLGDARGLAALDGHFAAALWDRDTQTLRLLRDPFGVRGLVYALHRGALYFASELKQLLAIPDLPVEADLTAIHKYLTFSFVPGEDLPVKGVRRLLPGRVLAWRAGAMTVSPYFTLTEAIDPALADQPSAVRLVRDRAREAVQKRLYGESKVGLFLSGGIDSSGVAAILKQAGVEVHAFTLDFGRASVETEQAVQVARELSIELTRVPVDGADIDRVLDDLVWALDLPFGDAVTGPLYLLAKAARDAGLSCVFNGEGGDQLFGGWTAKPMVAAELYAGLIVDDDRDTRVERYLKSYHRFYGLEDRLYAPEFARAVGTSGVRRAVLEPHLESGQAATFLNRLRLADVTLKGSQNILPRMDRTAQAFGLDVRAPMFDRALAEASFRLPPQLKLRGATEKFVLKLALKGALPEEIIWRRKFGMGVPIREWTLGALAPRLESLIGPAALAKRGWFKPDYVAELRQGRDVPEEIRGRRAGERLWALAMLEAWARVFLDGRGRRPGLSQ